MSYDVALVPKDEGQTFVRIVEEETGFAAWDPQTGEAFSGTPDDERGLHAVREMHAAESAAAPRRQQDRRRARRYLLVGAVVTPVALLVMLLGEVRPLLVVALVVGVADLGIGAYLWRRSGAPGRASPET
jgi:hypothetical protein